MSRSEDEMNPIYLDYNATTPIAHEVAEVMAPFLRDHFGNPSSSHSYGIVAKKAIEAARSLVADLLGCGPQNVVFTSGGTESNNAAIKGIAWGCRDRGRQIITSAIEHPAVMEVCRWLEVQGFPLIILPVDRDGLINPGELERAISSDTLLVTVMHANNEVGAIQPIAELASIAHRHGALFHTDAAQSIGKIPVSVDELCVDLLTVAGHKLYAPKGIGALYVRDGIHLENLLHGAGHEAGRRPGTENVLEIVGLGHACEIAQRDLTKNMTHFKAMRDRLYEGLRRELGDDAIRLNGPIERRLPNTLSLSFREIEASALLSEISEQVAASAGAACHADGISISAVLMAMQVPPEWARGTIRFSVGRDTTHQEIDLAIRVIAEAVRRENSILPRTRDASAIPSLLL
jgi:cysteine desulfurase